MDKIEGYVAVSAPDFFKGNRVGVIVGPCKDHDGAYMVYVGDKELITNPVCVNPQKGDLLISAEKPEKD